MVELVGVASTNASVAGWANVAALVALLSTNGAVGWLSSEKGCAVWAACGGDEDEGGGGDAVLHTRLPLACQKQDTLALRGVALVGWGVLQDI